MLMNSLRESLASIPGALSNFITENPLSYMSQSISTPSSHSGDEGSDKSQAIPATLIKEQWQLILGQDASISELESAIERCKELVLVTNECSDERKWLVRHLVELRFHLKELQEAVDDPNAGGPSAKVVLGHHLLVRQIKALPNVRQYCDHCTGIIWSVVQSSYVCSDCGFLVHNKCIDNIIRICAHVIASERKYPISEICPEIGLAAQGYKCAECQTPLNFKWPKQFNCWGMKSKEGTWVEPRLCDYCGLFFCTTCHWNDVSLIPARVVHNWDFTSRKVCRASLQEINLLLDKPVINLEEINPKLFVFLQKLSSIKKLRQNLVYMRKYLSECRKASEVKLLDHQIGIRRHLIQSTEFYSISDLVQAESGVLLEFLNKLFDIFDKHIRNCDICAGKGYICEICSNDEIIYPFGDGSIPCDKCNTIYHRVCWTRKNMLCQKCIRLDERKQQQEKVQQDETNGN